MNRVLFISPLFCLFIGACVMPAFNTDSYNIVDQNNNNEIRTERTSSIEDPILGPKNSDFADGSFISGVLEVTIEVPGSELHEDLIIMYTLDGTEPTKDNGEIYTDPIPILCDAGETFTVRTFALTEKLTSNISQKEYTCKDTQLEQPIINPYQREYEAGTTVEISITDINPLDLKGVKIVYTTDGSAPTTKHGILYEHPFAITGQAGKIIIVRTFAFLDDGTPEFPASSITRQDFAFLPPEQ